MIARAAHVQAAAIVLTLRLTLGDPSARSDISSLLGPIGVQPGCRRCELLVDAGNAGSVTLVEEWATRADLERHFRSEECRRLLALLELADAPPELWVDSVARREGIEAIAVARARLVEPPSPAARVDRDWQSADGT